MTYEGELEERLAAVWAHYPWDRFKKLDGDEQAGVIASYRANNYIEGVLAHRTATKNRPKAKAK